MAGIARRALVSLLVGALPGVAAAGPLQAWRARRAQSQRQLVDQLDREVIALRQRVAAQADQLETCTPTQMDAELFTELRQVFEGSLVSVARAGGEVQLVLQADLLFATGSLRVREEARFALDLLATALTTHSDQSMHIIGYTDIEPPLSLRKDYPTSWALSVGQALAVAQELMEVYRLPPARVLVSGRGDQDAVATNDAPEGRALNRRVEIRLRGPVMAQR